MKTIQLPYGKSELTVRVPDRAVIVEPREEPGLPDAEAAAIQAVHRPIGGRPLRELAQGKRRICIVISDITRPTPNHLLVPWLLQELTEAGVADERIVVLNGTGTHRDQTRDELVMMLGDEVVDRVRVINHHCQAPDELSHVGRSRFGCEVYLNRAYVEADLRIVTGFIEPHFFAGFSGGPKGIMPGIAGMETILAFHSAAMIGHPLATWGNLEGNPLQEMTCEINRMCPPHFLLNVTLNDRKEITGVYAGDWLAAHRKGCEDVKARSMVQCGGRFDMVLTSNAGYPLDQNLYQAVKGMSAAAQIVKPGGAILIAAECSDGIPDHGNYLKILQLGGSPQGVLDAIARPDFRMPDQWQAQKQAVIQSQAEVYLYSTLPEEKVRQALLEPVRSLEDALERLLARCGDAASIAVMPQGPMTIPYV